VQQLSRLFAIKLVFEPATNAQLNKAGEQNVHLIQQQQTLQDVEDVSHIHVNIKQLSVKVIQC